MPELLKVAIVTSWDERCGNAGYAANLAKALSRYPVKVEVVSALRSPAGFEELGVDVALFNYAAAMTMDPEWLNAFPKFSVKKVLLRQETTIGSNRSAFTDAFDAVVVHHKEVVHEAPNFRYIPHGILEVKDLPEGPAELVVGTAGIPHGWKGHVDICRAVALIPQAKACFIMPETRHGDARDIAAACQQILPPERLSITHDWCSDEAVVRLLAMHTSVYAFGHTSWYWAAGVSGGVRLGIAAHRPVVVPDLWHFKDVREHAYTCDTRDHKALADTFVRAHKEGRDPAPALLPEMGWSVVGGKFWELAREVLG